jgi:hypothetical protein
VEHAAIAPETGELFGIRIGDRGVSAVIDDELVFIGAIGQLQAVQVDLIIARCSGIQREGRSLPASGVEVITCRQRRETYLHGARARRRDAQDALPW